MTRYSSRIKVLVALFASAFMVFAMAATAWAEEGYGYRIRVFPGNHGTYSGDKAYVWAEVEKGTRVFDLNTLGQVEVPENSKYSKIGFRKSGDTNNESIIADGIIGHGIEGHGIEEDEDYVVAYGVAGNLAELTVQYVDYTTGEELIKPRTYYGTIGSKLVISYVDIEGYRPEYMQITGTLESDGNVWTFKYIKLAAGETFNPDGTVTVTEVTIPGETTVVETTVPGETTTVPGNTTVNTTVVPGGVTTNTTTVPGGTTTTYVNEPGGGTTGGAEAAAPAATETAPAAEAAPTQTTTEAPATREILDLDTPLAGPETTAQGTKDSKTPVSNGAFMLNPPVLAGLGIGLAVALALLWFFVRRYKKEDDEEA